jgi:hypothetical protein
MILDTAVLIELQKEFRRGRRGAASRLLETSGDAAVFITFVTWLEFAEGFGDDDRVACERFLSGLQVLWPARSRPETNGTSAGLPGCPSARTEPLAGGPCQI